jgi:formylglycine-generating enzyme required for sulfatase activity
MDPVLIAIITSALGEGLWDVGKGLLATAVKDPALRPVTQKLEQFLQRRYEEPEKDEALLNAVKVALAEAGAPTDDEDDLRRWLKNVSLDRLTAKKNHALRRQVARAVLAFTDPEADPPKDLMIALGWPRSRRQELSTLLAALRAQFYTLEDWRAPIEYADQATELGLLGDMLAVLARLDNVFVETEAGQALRVFVVQQGLTEEQAAEIEERYRADLVRELRMHDFRGIVQMRRDIRMPLADIYLELGLLSLGDEEERARAHERLLALREEERLAEEERHLRERGTDTLARSQRLVILGEPGAGKTISLRFISLMLAHGYGAARLGLEAPYIPLMVRLADFARELAQTPALSLDNFLLQVIGQAYASHPRLSDFLRLALDKGACMVLLDGLDEVGDDPVHGQPLRTQVVQRVQQFGDRWCADDRPNQLVVTSRIEGYWDEALRGFDHVELSPLRPPDEVREFLLRWYTAHEQAHDETLPLEVAEGRAEERVDALLPRVLEWPSVRRLATNPLLLTILALIHENVGKLPNRRIRLYEICAQTLIESWRQAQTGLPSELLAELGEETVIRVMSPLAYWLHDEQPGGTASFQEWRERLLDILAYEGYEDEAREIADRFLHHARYEAGLLAERGLGQFGFFHLTFEEYLAARQIARQRAEERRAMLRRHWQDPRWHEVLLLAAGQLGIVEARRDDVSDCIEDLLQMEPYDAENAGRQVVLAGRALADIGLRSVTNRTRHWVLDALCETMQDLDSETKRPHDPPQIPVRTRYDAGKVLDELGWLPDDLNAWLHCPGTAEDGGNLMVMKYPVTNAQFERFILAGGYENPAYWGGEDGTGWQWVQHPPIYLGEGPVAEPWFWHDPRFGKERRGYPVVGVSWYEAVAYAAWLTELLQRVRDGDSDLPDKDIRLVANLLKASSTEVGMPTDGEWERVAGGTVTRDRYPWDPPEGPITREEADLLVRANTDESGIGGTSPVDMYPLGVSQPFGLMDLAGNIWEWTNSWYDERQSDRVLRGGSWVHDRYDARCRVRSGFDPHLSLSSLGFRLVSPVGSGF